MINKELFKSGSQITQDNLSDAIQQAIEIEIATIPTYLYTYYSIIRSPNQAAVNGIILEALLSKPDPLPIGRAKTVALDISAQIMVYANKAGAIIMSVAIEEMLHMALSSNLKQSLIGMPHLYGKSPENWPVELPGHEPPFKIDLAKFSLRQLITFLKIESPVELKKEALLKRKPIEYKTIGEFYKMLEDFLEANPDLPYDEYRPQLIEGKGYYASNTIDTVYYDKKHKPEFVNADFTKTKDEEVAESGDLMLIKDLASALKAMQTIVHQGEGSDGEPVLYLNSEGRYEVDCSKVNTESRDRETDDPMEEEENHYYKFAQIYCEYKGLSDTLNTMGIGHIDLASFFVRNYPSNPVTANYPANVQPVSNLLNAIYTYIFVMIEGCYRESGHKQYEIFMFGVHKSMIFILNSLCGDISNLSYTAADGNTYTVAPTFENYPFNMQSSPKQQLIGLYNAAVAVYPAISYLEPRFYVLPDVALQSIYVPTSPKPAATSASN